MSIWRCRTCCLLQGFAESMRCFSCAGELEMATIATTQDVQPQETQEWKAIADALIAGLDANEQLDRSTVWMFTTRIYGALYK